MNENELNKPLLALVDSILDSEDVRVGLYYFLEQLTYDQYKMSQEKEELINNLSDELGQLQKKYKELSTEYGAVLYANYKEAAK